MFENHRLRTLSLLLRVLASVSVYVCVYVCVRWSGLYTYAFLYTGSFVVDNDSVQNWNKQEVSFCKWNKRFTQWDVPPSLIYDSPWKMARFSQISQHYISQQRQSLIEFDSHHLRITWLKWKRNNPPKERCIFQKDSIWHRENS